MFDFREAFLKASQLHPNIIAVIDSDREISYGDFFVLVTRYIELFAANSTQRTKSEQATAVFICKKTIESVAAAYACFLSNITYVPIDGDAPRSRLVGMLRLINPSLLVTDHAYETTCEDLLAEYMQGIDDAATTLIHLQAGEVCGNSTAIQITQSHILVSSLLTKSVSANKNNIAYMMFTSGSTGIPKAVPIEYQAINNFYHDISAFYPVDTASVCMNTAPNYFDVSVLDTWFPLAKGATLVLTQKEDLFPPLFLRKIQQYQVEYMCCVAPQLKLVARCKAIMEKTNLSSLKVIMTGAESPNPEAMSTWIRNVDHLKLLNGYGPTESTCVSTVYTISAENVLNPTPYPMGKPLGNVQIKVQHTESGDSSATEGELLIGGGQLMPGYYRNPEETNAKILFIPEGRFYRSGDKVRILDNGDLLYLGRVDHEVKVSGFRIHLGELETVAEKIEGVHECVAAVIDIEKSERQIVLAFSGALSDNSSLKDVIFTRMRALLPHYMHPKHVFEIETLPKLGNGKLDRKKAKNLLEREVRKQALENTLA